MGKAKIDDLRDRIIRLNNLYRQGTPSVSDAEYDALVEELKALSPDDELFKSGVYEEATDRMEALPAPMYSLEKVKTVKELLKWLQKMRAIGAKRIVVSPKFDGISLVVDESTGRAWTRGDGVQGQRSDAHYKAMRNGEENDFSAAKDLITWGEAIVPRHKFNAEESGYKNARNMVAGIFNSPDGYNNPQIGKVHYVRYGMLDEKFSGKAEQFDALRELWGQDSWAKDIVYDIEDLFSVSNLDEKFDDLFAEYGMDYKIDGLVFEVDEFDVRHKVGRLPNNNPGYAVALKKPEWSNTYETTVVEIKFGIGKTGTLNPVMIVEPVEMEGATVRRASVYNARYIATHNIHPGARIEIMRSGDVIPKHLRTLEYDEGQLEAFLADMCVCPSCGESLVWDDTETNLVCKNPDCKERVISEMVYFFRTMGCEEFEDPTIRTLYGLGCESIQDILDLELWQMKRFLGEKKGETVFNQIRRVTTEGVPMARFLNALNLFDGKIAEKTIQKIFDNCLYNPFEGAVDNPKTLIKDLQAIEGVAEITAKTFVQGIERFGRQEVPDVAISYIYTPYKAEPREDCLYVCMTGFRSKELEKALTDQGHVVLNGVTKECNVLVVADLNSTSSKMQKARERGIRIVTREEFENEIIP